MEGATDDNASLRVESFACYLETAKENLVHRVSAQENSIILNSGKTTEKPSFNANFSHSKDSKKSLTDLRVDSFSYLNPAGENFVFHVPGPIQDPTAAFNFSRESPEDSKISILGADKYFNLKLENHTGIKPADSGNEGPINLLRAGSDARLRASSLHFEASSVNSHTAFSPNLQRNESQMKQKKATRRRIFRGFVCPGLCFDKKSVHVNKLAYYNPKPTRMRSERIDHLASVPVPNPGTANSEEPRNSIEVFGSGTTSKGDVATNMERKLSILTWDAIPEGQNLPTSTVGSGTNCDDMASEASSDLFEIENMSGSVHQTLTSGAADDLFSCMSPTSHYAPSEASIQWSVVTASAADYSSVLSDYNDQSVAGEMMSRNNNGTSKCSKTKKGRAGKEAQKNPPGGLLGCKSHKAVDVAENVCYKTNEKAKHHQGLDLSAVSLGKSQAGGRGRVNDIATLQLPR